MATQLRNALAADDEANRQAMRRTLSERSSPQAQASRSIAAGEQRAATRAPFSQGATPAAQIGAERTAARRAAVIPTEPPGQAAAERIDWNRQVRPGVVPEPAPAPNVRAGINAQPPAGAAVAERAATTQAQRTLANQSLRTGISAASPAPTPQPAAPAAPAAPQAPASPTVRTGTPQPGPATQYPQPTPAPGRVAPAAAQATAPGSSTPFSVRGEARSPVARAAAPGTAFSRAGAVSTGLRTGMNNTFGRMPGVGLAVMGAGMLGDQIVEAVQNPQSRARAVADAVRNFFSTGQPQSLRPVNPADAYSEASVPTTNPGIDQAHLPAPAAPTVPPTGQEAAPPAGAVPANAAPPMTIEVNGVAPQPPQAAAAPGPGQPARPRGPFTSAPAPAPAAPPVADDGSVIVHRGMDTSIARPDPNQPGLMVEAPVGGPQLASLDQASLIQFINAAAARGDQESLRLAASILGNQAAIEQQTISADATRDSASISANRPFPIGGGQVMEMDEMGNMRPRTLPTVVFNPRTNQIVNPAPEQQGKVITQAQAQALRAALAQSGLDDEAIEAYLQANQVTVR